MKNIRNHTNAYSHNDKNLPLVPFQPALNLYITCSKNHTCAELDNTLA